MFPFDYHVNVYIPSVGAVAENVVLNELYAALNAIKMNLDPCATSFLTDHMNISDFDF